MMADKAERPGGKGKGKGRAYSARRSTESGAFTMYLATGLHPMQRTRARPAIRKAEDPNDGSPYLQELRRLGDLADRGETVDSTGMTDQEFLKAFLGH